MSRLIELVQQELAVFEAVVSYRPRSLVLVALGLLVGPMLGLLACLALQASTLSGMEQAFRPAAGVFALVLTMKFLFLAIQTYLKDRAAVLRF